MSFETKIFGGLVGLVVFLIIIGLIAGNMDSKNAELRRWTPEQLMQKNEQHNTAYKQLFNDCMSKAPSLIAPAGSYDYTKVVDACDRVAQSNTR